MVMEGGRGWVMMGRMGGWPVGSGSGGGGGSSGR